MNQRYPSALLENAVNELASLPGVGRKTALRLALYMLRPGRRLYGKLRRGLGRPPSRREVLQGLP